MGREALLLGVQRRRASPDGPRSGRGSHSGAARGARDSVLRGPPVGEMGRGLQEAAGTCLGIGPPRRLLL